ncbi:MAG: TrkA family potassium uptake protein [Armatimonadota bacterium]|nr:TrkA family potassium uptake protein [Armatimonadota bacterium]MDH7481112.1 TrkA family potassium uptake protein [Armatimonadota bacterium]
MKVIILGCGRIGSTLARSLVRDGEDVTIIDRTSTAFRRLGPDFKGKMVLGNGIDEEVMLKAGIKDADAFIAVTNGDNTNIMSVQIAKEKFHVPKVIARIYDPIRAYAYRELGLQTICTTVVGARLIKDTLLGKELGAMADYCALNPEDPVI